MLVGIRAEGTREEHTADITDDIDDLYRTDGKQKVTDAVGTEESDGGIARNVPKHGQNDHVAKILTAEGVAYHLAHLRHVLPFGRLFPVKITLDKEEADKIGQGEDQDGHGGEDKAALQIVGRLKGIHRIADHQRHHHTADKRDHLLGGREAAAMVGINEGVAPLIEHCGDEIVTKVGKEHAGKDQHLAIREREGHKGDQIQDREEELPHRMDQGHKALGINDPLHHEYRNELKKESKRDQRGYHADEGIVQPDPVKKLGKEGIPHQKGSEIFKGTLGRIGIA